MFINIIKKIFWGTLLGVGLSGGAVAAMYYKTLDDLPNVEELKKVTFERPMSIYTADNKLIGEFGEHKRFPVDINEIPDKLKQAFLAIEDTRFYEHTGIDPVGIIRAIVVAVTKQKATQGASTITQQVARNFFLSREKTLERKIKEVFISWRIEQVLTKDEILELYLNKIALGHRAYGVAAAAQVYYGKDLQDLTLGQMATIAGLPKAPSSLNPISHPNRSKDRRNLVLSRMLSLGYITQEEFDKANSEPYKSYYHSTPIEAYAPYVAEEARIFAIEKLGEQAYTDNVKIYTTVNAKIQNDASRAVFRGITEYDSRHGYRGPVLNVTEIKNFDPTLDNFNDLLHRYDKYQFIEPAIVSAIDDETKTTTIYRRNKGTVQMPFESISWARKFISDTQMGPAFTHPSEIFAVGDLIYVYEDDKQQVQLTQIPDIEAALVALNPYTGSIEAMVGGYDFAKSKLNRVTQAKRQTGSNFKPFLYSAALAQGIAVNSIILDEPIKTWDPGSAKWWSPKNTPNKYDGPMTLREGLAKSKNVVSIRLIRHVGVQNVVTHLKKFGIDVPKSQQSESMALGSVELTPLETARGMTTFANGGYLIDPYLISKITRGENDEVVYEAQPKLASHSAPNRVINGLDLIYDQDVPKDENMAKQILSHKHAFIMADMMHSVIYGGKGLEKPYWGTGGRASRYTGRSDLSGKTGTTNKVHDAWFTGFNKNLVATAWVGFDNSRNLGYSRTKGFEGGAYTALPIFSYFFKDAQEGVENSPIPRPQGLTMRKNATLVDYSLENSEFVNEIDLNVEQVENTGVDSSNVNENDIFSN